MFFRRTVTHLTTQISAPLRLLSLNSCLFCSLFCLFSCSMVDYHPYDGLISGATSLTEKNISKIERLTEGKKSIKFAMISDTQGWYDETNEVVNAINKRSDIDFVIHGGDQSDFGVTKEFIWMRDALQRLKVPYVCVIGNHDCLGNGEEVYKKIYGQDNFAFTAGVIRFICLNTNALEYDYPHPVPDFVFLDSLKANFPKGAQKTVFAMHVKPTDFIFNNNVANIFERYVTSFPKTQFCLYGHNHSVSVDDVFGDGIIYYECASINKRSYLVFTIKEEGGYDYEVVTF